MSIPAACQPIQDEINKLQERQKAEEDLFKQQPPPTAGERAAIVRKLEQIGEQIDDANGRLKDCIIANGGTVSTKLDSQLSGTATLTTTLAEASGPFSVVVSVELEFSADRMNVVILGFPPVVTPPMATPIGDITLTITMSDGGRGRYSNGAIDLPITLSFTPSKHIPFELDDATLPLDLTTSGPIGSPIDAAGNVTLTGEGAFAGGPPLAGNRGTLTIQGNVNPRP